MRGIRATLGTAPKVKTPATADLVARMIASCPDPMIGKRDRALLALGGGFAGAFRRSELIALAVEDLTGVADGASRSAAARRTRRARGQEIAIPRGYHIRPVETVQAWLAAAEISARPVFRQVNKGGKVSEEPLGDDGYVKVIKRRAATAGLDPAAFSGHSLRSGFLTSAAESGSDVFRMAEVSRHRSMETLRRYVRRGNLFKGNAGAAFP